MTILWLGEAACHDPLLTGGKAAALSRLAAAYPVPPGFCLGASAPTLADAPTLREQVSAAYHELGRRCGQTEPPVAVRSSAIGEDGATASFAGQFESYLNICGATAVLDAIRRCQDSARATRVSRYRQHQGLDDISPSIPVLVQALLVADTSAVVFSADPRTGERDQIVVTATWGLGESLVGGTTTPDTWIVRKDDLVVREAIIGEKERMTIAIPGGTREVATPRFLREQSSLTTDQIAALADLARTLEETTGAPVDLECAYANGRLALLQCRPITTLRTAASLTARSAD